MVSVFFILVVAAALRVASAAAGQLQGPITDFGPNPTNAGFYIYVPSKLQVKPPIVVEPHWCHGSAQAAFAGSGLSTFADIHGFIIIFPDSPNTVDKCWDVSSNQTLTHNGGGDSLGIVSMVTYTLEKYSGDSERVFSYGVSSGAMMTNVLLGSYPDIFAAGSAWAGVAFGCFAGSGYDVWSDDCATGKVNKTAAQWKDIVTAAYPKYTGWRPKIQVFHGSVDTVLYPENYEEEIKEWTAVLGLPSEPVSTLPDTPAAGTTTYVYGESFQAALEDGVTHNIPINETVVLSWFDLACTTDCFHHGTPTIPYVAPTSVVTVTTSTVSAGYRASP